jgi:hydroxymethylglutaryl-CoA synthase
MAYSSVGISDISVYVPAPRIELATIVDYRGKDDPKLHRILRRAVQKTGQTAIRFPSPWQDNAVLAAEATRRLIRQDSAFELPKVRFLSVGTETSIDHSKPISAYVEGVLQRSGIPIPTTMSTFQVQHACAAGTIAMLGVGAMLQVAGRKESGIVVTSDIARYQAPSTAEITQGAGAAAMLVEPNPKLIELDMESTGFASNDVDDFFRPLGSTIAKVKGGYSMQCYFEALESAFQDHCSRLGRDPAEVLKQTDIFVLHVPFKTMALSAIKRMIVHHLHLSDDEVTKFLVDRDFEASIAPAAEIGNTYTASTFVSLAFLLKSRYDALGDDIVGKRVLLASYGSGNTMVVLAGKVAEQAPGVIRRWDLDQVWQDAAPNSIDDYLSWLESPVERDEYNDGVSTADIPTDSYYLAGIREDGYREYEKR